MTMLVMNNTFIYTDYTDFNEFDGVNNSADSDNYCTLPHRLSIL